jgi:hypothetical protein
MVSALALPQRASAWGDLAHQVICEIAFRELTVPARTAVTLLLQHDPDPHYRRFTNACTWADHPRKRASEHFLNLPRTQPAVTEADRTCPLAPTCLLTAIATDTAVLKDANATDAAKREALKYLGHWLGDLHQPLHISFADDKGGNGVDETGPCRYNLHAVWDTCLLTRSLGRRVTPIVTALRPELTAANRQAWTQGDVFTWANESYQIARSPTVEYCIQVGDTCQYASDNATFAPGETERTVPVDAAYIAAHAPTVRSRLLRAGVRLGHLLNEIFGPTD